VSTENDVSAVEALARLAFVTTARLEACAAGSGLSVQQVRLLGILRDREPTINELAAHVGTDKSSMSGAVARAERHGLVGRAPDPQDGRAVRVRLEPAGRTLLDEASARFQVEAERTFATLTAAERAQWVDLTNRLLVAGAHDGSFGL
jgi:DNA-binding MarR family transcriptional regulator